MAQIELSNPSSTTILSDSQEYEVHVNLTISAKDETMYYLRGVFYKQNTSDYCGYTWNGNAWFKGPYSSNDGWKNFLPVSTSSSSASTQLKAKIDTEDADCLAGGEYRFKVQRFTDSGSATFDTQNNLTLTISVSTPTPIPTQTFTPKPPTKTIAVPSSSPAIVRLTPTTNVPHDLIISTSVNMKQFNTQKNSESTSSGSISITNIPQATDSQTHILVVVLILIGSICFIASAIYFAIKHRKKLKVGMP